MSYNVLARRQLLTPNTVVQDVCVMWYNSGFREGFQKTMMAERKKGAVYTVNLRRSNAKENT